MIYRKLTGENLETCSLYRGVPSFVGADGRTERRPRSYKTYDKRQAATLGDKYTILEGDRIDVLAFNLLGDSRNWKLLVEYNADVIEDELRLPVGAEIFVPRLDLVP